VLLNRRARFYRLTATGRKQLQTETRDWNQTAAIIAASLRSKPRTCHEISAPLFHSPLELHHAPLGMNFGTARDLSSQVDAIPMTSFGMLMNSPGSEFQRISPQKRAWDMPTRQSDSVLETWTHADFPVLISPDGVSQFRVVKQLVTSE
jgi:hypothetical protein